MTHQNNNYFNTSQSLKNLIIKEKAIGVDTKQFYSRFYIKTINKKNEFLSTLLKIHKKKK